MKIALKNIKADAREISPRIETGTDKEIVRNYLECFEQLPPIVVFKVPENSKYLLVDGWHRYGAAKLLELETIEADIHKGSLEDAKEYALLANLRHGLPLTRKEKRHVIAEFLKLHPERSNAWIAADLATRDVTVEAVRQELETASQIERLEWLVGRDGKNYPRTLQLESQDSTQSEALQEDNVDERPAETGPIATVPMLGPYELNQVHHADCLDALPLLPESSIDLVVADPPYNLGIGYGASVNDSLPDEDYYEWCTQWFLAIHRILKTGGAFYVMHYPEIAAQWKQRLDLFLTFRRWITWVYPSNIGHSKSNWTRAQRTILYYIKGDSPLHFDGDADPQPYKNPNDMRIKHLEKAGTTPYDWWEYNLVKNVSKDKTGRPNQLPCDLVYRIIATSCSETGIVLDPFMGSGTTAEAAIEAGRDWIGFDVDAAACSTTRERIEIGARTD